MAIALLTPYLSPYRMPLFERLAERHGVEVLCFGASERYVPPWFADLDAQLASAPFPARRLGGAGEAFGVGRRYEAVIAPLGGGAIMPAAFLGARRFVLWASVWAEPRSLTHLAARPVIRHAYRRADAVIAYGEHVRRFVAGIRGTDTDVFVAPQSVEAEVFGRSVAADEVAAFRARFELGDGPLVMYVGRLVAAKGIEVLLAASRGLDATLVLVGDGPLAAQARVIGPLAREELPVAYAAASVVALPSIPTPRFKEPWGLVCNEAMHQGRPVVASDAVGAVAGGLVVDGETGLVVPAGEPEALRDAIGRLLADAELRARLGSAGRDAVAAYNYDAMVGAFDRALAIATGARARRRS
jgi:glycosyltransferase involved in cell wall biosynthesis